MKMNEDFDKIIKKEKRKKIVKTFVISVVTTLALLFIGYTVSNRGMALQYEKAKEMAMRLLEKEPKVMSTAVREMKDYARKIMSE